MHGSDHEPRDYEDAPLVVTWETTQACELTCDHCRADATTERHPSELTTDEARSLIDDVAAFDPTPVFVFSGGDPMERPDLVDLVAYADRTGVVPAVTPAPTEALDRAAVEAFAEAGARRMALSLDGATPEAHDAFRGEEGSFETIRRAADHAREAGLSLQVNTTVTGATVDDLPGIADLVEDLGAVMWEVFFLVPVGRGTELEPITPERSEAVMAWLYERSRSAPFRTITVEAPHYRRVAREVGGEAVRVGSTRAGKGFVFVSHLGDVFPSGFLPEAAGNVRNASLPEIYRDAPLFRRLRDDDALRGACGDCPHRSLCGGSRSRAAAVAGDPLAADPLCPEVSEP